MMRSFLPLVVLLLVLGFGSTPALAQEFTPGAAPHHGAQAYVACELHGQVAVVEGGNSPQHTLSADDLAYMRALCVREALYGGMGEGYWSQVITETDMKAARFWVHNR